LLSSAGAARLPAVALFHGALPRLFRRPAPVGDAPRSAYRAARAVAAFDGTTAPVRDVSTIRACRRAQRFGRLGNTRAARRSRRGLAAVERDVADHAGGAITAVGSLAARATAEPSRAALEAQISATRRAAGAARGFVKAEG